MTNQAPYKGLLFSAALFNWVAASTLCFAYKPLFTLIGITPLPEHPLFLQLFAILAFLFGIGYYWASQDLEKHQNIIMLGIIGKLMVFFVPLGYWLANSINWPLLLLVSIDFVYAALFIRVLILHKHSRESNYDKNTV